MCALAPSTSPLRWGGSQRPTTRRTTRFALCCELLESRQLLSIGQASLGAGVLGSPSTATTLVSVSAAVSDLVPSSFSNGTEFGFTTSGDLNPIGSLGTPTLPNSANASIFVQGDVNGNSVNAGDNAAGLSLLSNTAISPLNASLTSSITSSTEPQPDVTVFVIPPPLAPAAVHLGPSTAPPLAVSNSTTISNLDEQPASITHFGQGNPVDGNRMLKEVVEVNRETSSLIDDLEPLPPAASVNAPQAPPAPPVNAPETPPAPPVDAPKAPPAPQNEQPPTPDARTVRPLPPTSDPDIDAALDPTDAHVLTRSRDGDASQPDDQLASSSTSRSFSVVFGIAAVATGGYHVALRQSDRLKGRWIPRWVGAERPNKRKLGSPPR
jgi:hypothetical protein